VLLKSGQKFWGNVITKILRLPDRMTRTWHTFHSSLEVSLKHITPSVLKNYVRVPQKMDMKIHFRMLPVGRQVMDTLFLFRFYNNLYYTQGAQFYSIIRLRKSISIPVNNTNVHNTHNHCILCAACLWLVHFM